MRRKRIVIPQMTTGNAPEPIIKIKRVHGSGCVASFERPMFAAYFYRGLHRQDQGYATRYLNQLVDDLLEFNFPPEGVLK